MGLLFFFFCWLPHSVFPFSPRPGLTEERKNARGCVSGFCSLGVLLSSCGLLPPISRPKSFHFPIIGDTLVVRVSLAAVSFVQQSSFCRSSCHTFRSPLPLPRGTYVTFSDAVFSMGMLSYLPLFFFCLLKTRDSPPLCSGSFYLVEFEQLTCPEIVDGSVPLFHALLRFFSKSRLQRNLLLL